MKLSDLYTRFDHFVKEVLHIEGRSELGVNMFAIEQTDPTSFYIMHYPYTDKSDSEIEYLSRLGVLTASCISKEAFAILANSDNIRILMGDDGLMCYPFERGDTITVSAIPDLLPPGMISRIGPDIYFESVACNIYINIKRNITRNLPAATIKITTVPKRLADRVMVSLTEQIKNQDQKIVYLSPKSLLS